MDSDTVFGAACCAIPLGGVVVDRACVGWAPLAVDPTDPVWPAATRALLHKEGVAAGALAFAATTAAMRARMGNALETSTSAACVKKARALTKALGKDGAIYLSRPIPKNLEYIM